MASASSSSDPLPPSTDRTPDVASFLGQLSAGPSSSSKLPFEAQASLISAQLSNVEGQTAALVQQRRGDLAKLIDQSEVAEQRLGRLVGRIEEVERSTSGDEKPQLLSPALGSALQQYSDSVYALHRSDHLLQALQVVHTALSAIEALEDQVAQGRLEADAYAHTLAQTEAAYGGLLNNASSSSSNGSKSFTWLAESESSRAVADLLERRKYAKAAAEAMIERGWEQSVIVGKQPADNGVWMMNILQATQLSEHAEHSVSLDSLAQSLITNGSLNGKLTDLSHSLTKMLSQTCLSSSSSERWTATLDDSSPKQALLLGHAAGNAKLDCLETILEFLGARLLPALEIRAVTHFSRALLPVLIPLVLTKLRAMLPSSLQMPSITKDLAALKSSAERIYSSLEKSRLIPAPLDEDSEEAELLGSPHALLRFASSVHSQFSNKVAAAARDQARRLCMSEDETGWDTEQIEIEESLPLLENDEEWAVEEPLIDDGKSIALQDNGATNGDDWGWGETEEDVEVPPPRSSAPANMARSASIKSSTSSADGGTSYSRSSSPAGQRPGRPLPVKKGRGALGGVRVIKPADQMGSGPLPGDEDGDDAWGLDDDLAEEPPRTPVIRQPDVADAWGLDEEAEPMPLAANPVQALTTDVRRSLEVAAPAEDADDAWFTDEVDANALPSVPDSQVPMAASTSMSSTASYPSIDDLDEDAWGLSEEEKAERAAKRASMMGIPIGFKIPTEESASSKEAATVLRAVTEQANEQEKSTEDVLPSTRGLGDPQPPSEARPASSVPIQVSLSRDTSFSFDDEDELDEDAWGLSAEEQKERAEKRASKRLTLGQVSGFSYLQPPAAANGDNTKLDAGMVPEPTLSSKPETSEGDALTADNLEASEVVNGQDGSQGHHAAERQERLSEGLTPAGSIDVAPSEAHLSDLDSLHDHLAVPGSRGVESAPEISDNVSVVSAASTDQPFPVESALPQDLSSRASEAGSEAVLPATPQSERSEPTLGDNAAWEPETMSVHEGSIDGDRGGEDKTLFQVESALPISSASSVATGSAGPPSVGSLPPTPKAEADLSLPDERLPSLAGLSSTPPVRGFSASSSAMAMDSRPQTPFGAEHQSSEPPFPVHSAFPYHGTHRGSVMGTGPSSVASGFEGRSDIALPPSPPPPMDDDNGDGVSDFLSPVRGPTEAQAPQSTSEQGGEVIDRGLAQHQEETSQAPEMEEDDDPWGDADAQWEAEQQSQEAQRNVSHPSAEPPPHAVPSPAEAPAPSSDARDADEDWGWSDEPTHTAAAQQAATDAASSSTGASLSVAQRAIKPQKGRSSSPSGASPQLRQATRRSAEAAAAAAAAGLVGQGNRSVQSQGSTTRLTADALARNGDGAGVKSADQQSSAASNAAVPSSKRRVESCKISKRSRELIKLAHRILDDTIALAESDGGADSEAPSPLPLLRSLADIFELYRALMPTLHYQTLTQIPSLAMQFANDCRFLAKEILLLSDRLHHSSALLGLLDASPDVLDLPHEASLMTSLGKQVFESQMASQASTLDELLTQTDSLLRVYQEERFSVCSKVLAQLVHHLGALHRGWSEVLTPSSCAGALGTLVEAVLLRLGGDVLEIDDIGEREGERLAELIRLLVPLEKLFPASGQQSQNHIGAAAGEEQDTPTSSVASFVPSWVKITGYLPEILLGSLADVEFLLFEAGGLLLAPSESVGAAGATSMGFTREEARRLIRSTFADTPRRAALLGRVERGS
ncbi:hypothetical protein BCV69DRAFT_312973 [Microstroma glucosiphilum]|uniref:Retrograde transport protein Dsl1 C-terminal domain-containing protein n=1 Tax=Pseudomicrostroma glucosiphilum TaxID=1684307 RepID=A0A316U559_9BASI|nr:hypothetical protein BCV69DRAFT_312973 [Pseudomicrostroma glucosiphilum]PWN20382.1 hypothetical protein BCV69DRAFT_312973 [Pseudomicrostroma glucosiphilum]